jgi:hypothetical protein
MKDWIAKLLDYRDLTRMGHLQRVEDANLGLGWIYYGLARVIRPKQVVVIGSYRGFVPRHCMNEHERRRYITWAEPYYETVRAEMAFLDGDIFHLRHGDVGKRKGRARFEGFRRFQFDPYADVAIEENGAWRWNTDKQEMHEYVRGYFASRMEDG